MNKAELIVDLVVPDTTAITTYHTLKKMGFRELQKVDRSDYYKFSVSEKIEKFSKKISKVDLLINANKHRHLVKKETDPFPEKQGKGHKVLVLVQSLENDSKNTLNTLQRLGLKQIKRMEKGTLWTLYLLAFDRQDATRIAEYITKSLLYNQHYQKYKIMG